MIKDNWYDLEYECEGGCDGPSPTVLYTSKLGLKSLIIELERIEQENSGRRAALDIPNMDYVHSVPFTHIEVREAPPEPEEEKPWSWQPFVYIGMVIGVIIILSGYGLVRLVMDIT